MAKSVNSITLTMKRKPDAHLLGVPQKIENSSKTSFPSNILANNNALDKYIFPRWFHCSMKYCHSFFKWIFLLLLNEFFANGLETKRKRNKRPSNTSICHGNKRCPRNWTSTSIGSISESFVRLRLISIRREMWRHPPDGTKNWSLITLVAKAIKSFISHWSAMMTLYNPKVRCFYRKLSRNEIIARLTVKCQNHQESQFTEIAEERHLSAIRTICSQTLNFFDRFLKKRDTASHSLDSILYLHRRKSYKNIFNFSASTRFVCCALLCTVIMCDKTEAKDKDKLKMINVNGDVIFGGMFPMHERGGDIPCGTIKEEKGIQRMEAMLYALDKINKDPNILPNITLGAMILDTCSSDTYALEQSMEFFRASLSQDVSAFKCEGGKEPMYNPPKPVAGVIGAASSSVSVMVANILRLFKIPQISYASTSTELSDKNRFDYFSRVVPPDNFQAMAMVEIVKELGWKYVSTLAVEGGYGEKGIASFLKSASTAGLCVAISERIKRMMSKPEEFDKLIETLSSKPQARVIVMFVDEDNTRRVLEAAKRANKTNQFLWVGSDSWGAKIHPVRDQEEVARDAITILPRRKSLTGFDTYIRSLRPKLRKIPCSKPHPDPKLYRNCRNIWFKEFWTHHFNCTFRVSLPPGSHRRRCTGDEHIQTEQEGLVPFVVDAVYALAHALHNLILDVCGEIVLCPEVRPIPPGPQLLQYIRNVSFLGQQDREVKFNKDGDAPGSYFIYQYQKTGPNSYDYVRLGDWTERLQINMSLIVWNPNKIQNNESRHPISICSKTCPTGFIRNFQDACCWSCVPCPEDSIIFNDTCKPCLLGWAPTVDKVVCYKLTPEHITWDSAWAIIPVLFSSVGLFFTLFTTIVFIRYNSTPIIMASGRELCYVLLLGIAVCYLMTFVILSPPSTPMCASFRIGVGLGLCICYSAIFTKTNRISRIFNRGSKSIRRPGYTSPRSQIVICSGLVSVQVIGCIAWLFLEFPETTEVYPYRLVAVLTCGISNMSFMISQSYNMILIILCTVYAFKTRKIPENFNESKYIGFTMYSTCIVWLAFVPIYFVTNNDYKIQLATLCMSVSISASVALGCLFTPKVYIVIFQPYKNVRQGSGQTKISSHSKNYGGTSVKFTPKSQTAQSVLSTNHSSSQVIPPSTISQHVNGEFQNLRPPPANFPPKPPKHKLDKGSIT